MLICNDFNDSICLQQKYAETRLSYKGTAAAGMLLWLDERLLKSWWKLSAVKVEPQPGGIFYLHWSNTGSKKDYVIYGVMGDIDTESHFFTITKMIYVANERKITGLDLSVSFTPDEDDNESILRVRLRHSLDDYQKENLDSTLVNLWPRSLQLFKNYIESY